MWPTRPATVAFSDRFSTAFDHLPCYVTVQGEDLAYTAVNSHFKADFGEPEARPCYRICRGRADICPECPVVETFDTGRSCQTETEWLLRDGSRCNLLVMTSPIRDSRGQIQQVLSMSTDIRYVLDIQDHLTSLGLMVGSVSHGIKGMLTGLDGGVYLLDSGLAKENEHQIREGLDTVKQMVGRIRKMVLDILFYAKDRDLKLERIDGAGFAEDLASGILEKAKSGGIEFVLKTEVIVVTAFGEMDTAIAALRLDASDFITKPIANEALHLALQRARDRYNGRKQLKEYTALLERSHARTLAELIRSVTFRNNLIESSLDGIMACDGAERIAVFNRSMGAITGYDPSQVLSGWKLSRFFKADEMARLKKALGETGAGGKDRLFLHETQLRGKNETAVPVQLSATLLPEENGTAGMVLILRDLREIRRLEQEMADQARILHQDKMMSLGRLAASVVHEINNPLSGILNYLRLMSRIMGRGTLSEARQEKFSGYLDIVEKETARCSEIISGLLTFSRKSPPVFGTVRIDNVRELENVLEHALIICQEDSIEPRHLPSTVMNRMAARNHRHHRAGGKSEDEEKERIIAALREHDGRREQTAKALGMDRTTLWRKMKRYGIEG